MDLATLVALGIFRENPPMKTLMRRSPVFAALGLLVLSDPLGVFGAEPVRLDLADPGWEFSGDDTVVEEFEGRLALRLKSGKATYLSLIHISEPTRLY